MKYFYTAIITPTEDGAELCAQIPDLPGCITTGDDLNDAIEQITDAAASWLVFAEDKSLEIPAATAQNELAHDPSSILSIIQVDTIAYRTMTGHKGCAENVSLTAWMAELADKKGINCSQVLQDGLRAQFNAG